MLVSLDSSEFVSQYYLITLARMCLVFIAIADLVTLLGIDQRTPLVLSAHDPTCRFMQG